VLPAATWGEKTGTFTNADRTVHLSEKAVDPPGQARADLDIFIDYARRLDLQDHDGDPLVKWTDSEGAFEGWKACSAGRPCDYSGLTYEKLRGGSGIQWPCNEEHPDGAERIYVDGEFWSSPSYCESYGKDLVTGAPVEPVEYKAMNPDGKAVIKAAEYLPSHEPPSAEFPYLLTTGRTLYHFHTRTKTGRVAQLQAAAPEVWVEMSAEDVDEHGWGEGDLLRVSTARGSVEARLRVCGIRRSTLFLPFHYGYWDTTGGSEPTEGGRAANELTVTDWDPSSKQPLFKSAAAQVERIGLADGPSRAPTTTASRPVSGLSVPKTRGGEAAAVVERLE